MNSKQSLKKIGAVAQALGTTTRALRFYEEEGLVLPLRTPKGTRLYSIDDIARLRVILLLAAADVPIEAIKRLSMARSKSKTGDTASRLVSGLLNELRKKVNEKKNQYAALERELRVTDGIVQQCSGCSERPTRDTCFTCTIVPEFRRNFMIKLIAEQDNRNSRTRKN